jgi:hypothetical protein
MATLGSSKASVLAVMPEVTEGTPVVPASGADFLTLQPDASLTPSFELLSNEELRSSIGKAKGIQGFERPEMSFSHYLKHSGVEGTAPEYNELLQAVFGNETANGTQRTTTTSSTVSVVKLGAGGTDFSRGFAVLIKDGTNGYSIRPVHSVATNDLTLGFNLANAPATGIGVGKCVNYSPANSAHQSLSAWMYRANGQAVEAIAGGKVTEFGFSASAGELINANFTLVGTKYYFNPITLGATDTKLDFTDDDGTFAATLTAKTYRDPHELATAITAAMNTASPGETHTCTYSNTTGKFTILCTGTVLSLLWNTGGNAANTIGDKIGFSTAADDSGTAATTGYTSDNAQSFVASYTPSYDSSDPVTAKYQEVLIGDSTDTTCFEAASIDFTMSMERSEVKSICAESGVNSILLTGREVTIKISALLDKYEAGKFNKFANNTDCRFCYNFGPKSGGNWVAGYCGNLYIPTATVTSYTLTDLDSVVGVELELKAYVDSSGNGEVYLNFL